ncbi:MAG: type IV pilus twitching motility protein PilT [Quadrisphaera sp.]
MSSYGTGDHEALLVSPHEAWPASVPAQVTDPLAGSASAAATGAGAAVADPGAEQLVDVAQVLRAMVSRGASDLHLTAGAPPMARLHGDLVPLEGFPRMTPEPLKRSLFAVLTQKQRQRFEEDLELDFALPVAGLGRFRVNLYRQRESVGAAFRVIPTEIRSLQELGMPPVLAQFATLPRGLVLVTGPTGSGKSTTLAAIIDQANKTRPDHIMTVEDPIEFLHAHQRSLVNQREVGEDTRSFATALKHVLRQDPDIILVGELRDLETISVALTAAETGHLVFATLHTQDAAQTIDRIIDVFPAEQQDQVRTQLAGALQGVVCQTLCKTSDGRGRAAATEVLIATPAVRNLVREGKTHQIYSAMQAGGSHGMHTLDQHLAELVRSGRVTYDQAVDKAHHLEDFTRLAGRA